MRKIFYLFLAALALVACDKGNEPTFVSEGALKGKFTINAAGDKIVFSKGNLQYVGTWQFAEHQWDTIGAGQDDDHRDLFCWGTGDAPNKISKSENDYADFVDWGVNPITNGGNADSLWRSLTADEWVYLFYSRSNAATLFALGSVNGVNGLILLPDNWTLPKGAAFASASAKGYEWENSVDGNYTGCAYTDNEYSIKQWKKMESAGAVFLPAAGSRSGTKITTAAGSFGFYWSATPGPTGTAKCSLFYSRDLYPQTGNMRYVGSAVRLVQDVRKK